MRLNKNYYDCDASFDCSYYLDQIELPHDDKGYDMKLKHSEMMEYVNSFIGSCDENYTNLLGLTPKPIARSSTDDYYPVECNNLLSSREYSDMEICRSAEHELELLSELSAEEDALLSASGNSIYGVDIDMVEYLLTQRIGGLEQYLLKNMEKKKRLEDVEWYGQELMEKSFNYSSPQTQNVADEFVKGFGEKRNASDQDHSSSSDEQTRKRRLCRHFLKGHCKRGNACDFLHDKSMFCPNSQKVFLGGLPAHITEVTLTQRLAEQGYEVINKPKVLAGFTPQVCLSSVEEAQRLIEKRNILIDGALVDVRAYEAFAKCDAEKIQPDEIKRSVFLGGLSRGTTSLMIEDDLEKMNVKVVNHPLVKIGFAPKVTLQTIEECEKLINLKKVRVNDTMVDVRPYINNKSPFRSYTKN